MITLSGFTDEVWATLPAQVHLARRLGLTHVELRRVGLSGVLRFSDRRLARVERLLAAQQLGISSIATPIGKSDVDAPATSDADDLRRAAVLAHRFGTPFVRVFSWFTPTPDADAPAVLDKMAALADVADAERVGADVAEAEPVGALVATGWVGPPGENGAGLCPTPAHATTATTAAAAAPAKTAGDHRTLGQAPRPRRPRRP